VPTVLATEVAATAPLDPINRGEGAIPEACWVQLAELRCSFSVALGVPGLTVRDVLHLSTGKVLNTQWRTNRDLPVLINGKMLGVGEFDAATEKLGIRITEFLWEQQP